MKNKESGIFRFGVVVFGIILTIVIVRVVVSFVVSSSGIQEPRIVDIKTERDPWYVLQEAVVNCKVKSISQSHSLDVVAYLKNGEILRAVEPMIDDIVEIVEVAEEICEEKIMIITE